MPAANEDRLLHLYNRGIAGCRTRDAREVRETFVQLIGALDFEYEEAATRLFRVYENCIQCVEGQKFEVPLWILERLRAACSPRDTRPRPSPPPEP
jgi:hypothetical protein